MCLICIEFEKQRMTTTEARRALGEMIGDLDADHVSDIEEMLADADRTQSAHDADDDDRDNAS